LPAKNLFDVEIYLPVQHEANLAFFPSLRSQFVITEKVCVQLAHNSVAVAPVRFAYIALAAERGAMVHVFGADAHWAGMYCFMLPCWRRDGASFRHVCIVWWAISRFFEFLVVLVKQHSARFV
jgi:hypothetical protein